MPRMQEGYKILWHTKRDENVNDQLPQTARLFAMLILASMLFFMACAPTAAPSSQPAATTALAVAPTQIARLPIISPYAASATAQVELPSATSLPTIAPPTPVLSPTTLAVWTQTTQRKSVSPTAAPTSAPKESLEKALIGRWNCEFLTIDNETTPCPDYEHPIEFTEAGTFLGGELPTRNAFTPPNLLNVQGIHGDTSFQVELSGDKLTLRNIESSAPSITAQYSRITSGIPDIKSEIVGQWECHSFTIGGQTNPCPESQSVIEFTNTGIFISDLAEPYSISSPNVLNLARLDGTGTFQVDPSDGVLILTVDNPARSSQAIVKYSRIK